jgi:MoxR-like ATPase
MADSIDIINEKVKERSSLTKKIFEEMGKVIVGQNYLLERLLVGLLSDGHILLEGVPGLAKSLSVSTLAQIIKADFKRIQFTPDLLPADLIGTLILNPKTMEFTTQKGPIFSNIILADEINRAPSKVQSALLEAMQERQVTISKTTYPMERLFMVLATQNPIEHEGTYPLPEAQVDRFMLKVKIDYPDKKEEREIIERMAKIGEKIPVTQVISPEEILGLRQLVNDIYIDEKIKNYILDVVFATRDPKAYGLDLENYIEYGASPRASIALVIAAKAHAFIRGRGYVTPQDVKSMGMDVLRHRVIPTYEAEAEEMTGEDILKKIFDEIEVP